MDQKVIFGFRWESGLSSASRNHPTTFCRNFVHYEFTIVFRDSSLYRKQLSVFCLLWLISACADCSNCIANFCSMIELLHELKNSICWHGSIHAFDNVSARKNENKKFAGLLYITKNPKFSCVLCVHSQFLCSFARFDLANRVCVSQSSRTFFVLDCSYSTRH